MHQNRIHRHFRALLIKRWHNAKRDRKVVTWTIVYPVLILLLGVGLLQLVPSQVNRRVLTPNIMNTPNHIKYSDNPGTNGARNGNAHAKRSRYDHEHSLAHPRS